MRLKEAEMAILLDLWADGNPAYEHLKQGAVSGMFLTTVSSDSPALYKAGELAHTVVQNEATRS